MCGALHGEQPACHAPTNTAASVFICNVVSIPDSCTCFSTSLHVHADNTEQETIQRPCCSPSHCALHAALGFTSESTAASHELAALLNQRGRCPCGVDNK